MKKISVAFAVLSYSLFPHRLFIIGAAVAMIMLACPTPATAANYNIIWNNQSGGICIPLKIGIKDLLGKTLPVYSYTPLCVGCSVTMTANSAICSSIELTALCKIKKPDGTIGPAKFYVKGNCLKGTAIIYSNTIKLYQGELQEMEIPGSPPLIEGNVDI